MQTFASLFLSLCVEGVGLCWLIPIRASLRYMRVVAFAFDESPGSGASWEERFDIARNLN